MKAFIPPFVAEYATSHEAPHTPQTELMFIIEPLWFLIMSGMASLQVENTDERLVFTILFQSSMLISCKSPMCEIPALFMSTSMLPKRSDILSNSAFTSSYFPTLHVTARQSAPSRRFHLPYSLRSGNFSHILQGYIVFRICQCECMTDSS